MVTMADNERSIPDADLEVIDATWGDDLPSVRKAVQRLWGVPMDDAQALRWEQGIARDVRDYTRDSGKTLTADEALVLLNLSPCLDADVYGVGSEWVDITGAAAIIGVEHSHVRRMIIDQKITVKIIHRPSSGERKKKRWLRVSDLERRRGGKS